MTTGDRIRTLREDKKLKQEEFAQRVGAKKNTVGRWERNEQSPDANEINAILKAFPDTYPAWLVCEEGPMKRDTITGLDLLAEVARQKIPGLTEAEKGIQQLAADALARKQSASNMLAMEEHPEYNGKRERPHAWFHDWIDEELRGKSISEVMGVAVKIKAVLDEGK